jgi:predicted metal-dependent enzyme (double-stranded beta helix superfamily)
MERFETFCGRVRKMLADEKGVLRKIEQARELVSDLAAKPGWFEEFMRKMIFDRAFIESQKPSIWPNEITLFRSPDRSFVVLAYIWDAKLADVVHDHGSWGIIGTLCAKLGERKYERLDDGKREGYAELSETESRVYGPGETTFVLPLKEGLHAMDNPTDGIAVSVNVYGRSIGRGYTQFFDPAGKTVTRVYPPRTLKEVLAAKALAAFGTGRAEAILQEAIREPQPPHLRDEFEAALARIRGK